MTSGCRPTGEAGSLERRIDVLVDESFDWLIVGGGVHGVALLFEAVRRGERALLLEAGDFGGETSWHSLRTLHGGLRYLQSLDLVRFRQSVLERRWFLRHFPDLTEPLDCLMPLRGKGLRRPSVFRAAFLLDALAGLDRNRGVTPNRRLAAGHVLGPAELRRAVPELRLDGLTGAAAWQDGAMGRSEALLIEWLRWAVALGGAALNRVRVDRILLEGGRVHGIAATDAPTGRELRFRARRVVNAAGPWCRAFAAAADRDRPELFHASLAFNLLLDREPVAGERALAIEPEDGGTLFLHPHQGRILVGTRHLPYAGKPVSPAAALVPEEAIEAVLGILNDVLPKLRLDRAAVAEVRAGFLPAVAEGAVAQRPRPVLIDHGKLGGPSGLHSVSGIKWTTARSVAAAFFDGAGVARARALPPRPAPHPGDGLEAGAFLALPEAEALAWLLRLRRTRSVMTVDDVLRRRTGWSADSRFGAAAALRLESLWPASSPGQAKGGSPRLSTIFCPESASAQGEAR